MAYTLESMKNDCNAAFELYANELSKYKKAHPYEICKIENWEKLQYTSDEKYFQYRREFNITLMKIFEEHRDKSFVAELDTYERESYYSFLKGIESKYFKEAVVLELELIGHL
ncbi:hypothetical protein [Flavobacterium sp.]|uniref:hypothetical protein n=1 Tax=Flavobacterium sp. TaxID=239 RepID=UPI0040339629